MKTLLKATAALTALVALLVGIPALLATAVGWPLPATLPDPGAVWDTVAAGNIATKVVINVLACAVWVAWLQIAVSALLETKAAVQGRMPQPVRGLASPIQLGVGKLVATTALMITVFPRSAMATPAPTLPLLQAMPAVSVVAPSPMNFNQSTVLPNIVASRAPNTELDDAGLPVWTVKRGDNLWDIAEVTLGSGDRWPEIFELNRGATQPDGRSLTDPGVLERGWELRLPGDASVPATKQPAAPASGSPTVSGPGATSQAAASYTVERGDSLWGIAAEHLGDGHRYVELLEINRGVAQPDGRSLSDPGTIEPGWNLTMPSTQPAVPNPIVGHVPGPNGATSLPATTSPATAPSEGERATNPTTPSHQPQESATPPSNAPTPPASSTPTAPSAPAPTAAPAPTGMPPLPSVATGPPLVPPAAQPTSPPTMRVLDTPLPTVAAPSPPYKAATPSASTPSIAAPVTSPPPSELPSEVPSVSEATSTSILGSVGLLGGAGGVLAAGVWAALRRRRRQRSIRRRPGSATPVSEIDLAEVLGSLRDAALASPAASIASLLRTLTVDGRSRKGAPDPQPVAVTVGSETVSVMLAEPAAPPPAGWSISDDEKRWEHPRRHRLPDLDVTSPLPALVTIGGTTDEPVLLDLEAAGVVSITGDDESVAGLVRSLVLELAETPFADSIRILVEGVEIPGIDEFQRMSPVDDLSSALDELVSTARQYQQALAGGGLSSCFSARSADVTGDGLPPTVVITSTTNDAVAEAARLLPGGSGAVLVVVGEIDAPALEIRTDHDQVEIPELGIRCPAQHIGLDAARQIGEAMATAANSAVLGDDEAAAMDALRSVHVGVAPAVPLFPEATLDPGDPDSSSTEHFEDSSYEDPPYEVCVRMLGSVTVTGAKALPTAQQEAILSYLITHRRADSLALQEALWRDKQPRKSRLHDVLYELRRSLGSDVLPATADNTNPLGPMVISDLELFDARVSAASQQTPEMAIQTLCGALELVRGTPFTYGARAARYYTWVDVENFTSTWEHAVGDVAHEVAKWFHREGDASTAAWAARQGLLASPLNEALTCDLMLSHDLAGDSRAAQSVFDEHERALESLGLGEAGAEMIEVLDSIRGGRANTSQFRAAAAQ